MKWIEAQKRATPFTESIKGIEPYGSEFCKMRDSLAELLQSVHKQGIHDEQNKDVASTMAVYGGFESDR